MSDTTDHGQPRRRSTVAPLVLEAPSRESTVTEVARQLLSQLLSGQIAPGTRLPSERQMAEAMRVGRSTIREALKALDVLGIIDVRQGDGTYLKGSTSELLPQAIEWGLMLGQPRALDLIEARRHLEVLTARLAAERADHSHIAELERTFAEMQNADDAPSFVQADVAFHLTLAAAAGNSVLSDILSSIRALLGVWIRRAITQAGETDSTCQEHAAVLEAVRAGLPDDAAAAMTEHMNRASKRLEDSLRDHAEDADSA